MERLLDLATRHLIYGCKGCNCKLPHGSGAGIRGDWRPADVPDWAWAGMSAEIRYSEALNAVLAVLDQPWSSIRHGSDTRAGSKDDRRGWERMAELLEQERKIQALTEIVQGVRQLTKDAKGELLTPDGEPRLVLKDDLALAIEDGTAGIPPRDLVDETDSYFGKYGALGALGRVLDRGKDQDRDVLTLYVRMDEGKKGRDIPHRTAAEIAGILGIPVRTANWRLKRAMKSVAAEMIAARRNYQHLWKDEPDFSQTGHMGR